MFEMGAIGLRIKYHGSVVAELSEFAEAIDDTNVTVRWTVFHKNSEND